MDTRNTHAYVSPNIIRKISGMGTNASAEMKKRAGGTPSGGETTTLPQGAFLVPTPKRGKKNPATMGKIRANGVGQTPEKSMNE